MSIPPHADPTLWEHPSIFFVMVVGHDVVNPIAHRALRIRTDSRWRWEMGCNFTSVVTDLSVLRPQWAAQFAVACLRCWPDAREGREATVAARQQATP